MRTETNKSELADLLDQHETIRRAHYQLNNGISHTKKTIEAMRRGSTRVCELTQAGKSCKCRDAKLSAYADQLRDLENAINARVNPIVPDLVRARRDRLRAQARELYGQARNLRNEAQQQAHQLEQRADALVEQSKSDGERAVEGMRAEGREFYETIGGSGIVLRSRIAQRWCHLARAGVAWICSMSKSLRHPTRHARVTNSSVTRDAGFWAAALFLPEAGGAKSHK